MDEKNETGSAAPEMPGKQPPLRRVGSFTLGVCLIAAGIFFLLTYFVPDFPTQPVLRIVPAAGLVLLGGEVLFFAARPGRWKLSQQYTADAYAQIRKSDPDAPVKDISGNVYLYTGAVKTLEDIDGGSGYVTLDVELSGSYGSAEQFAQACRSMTDAVQQCRPQPDTLIFAWSPDNDPGQSLTAGTLQRVEQYTLKLVGIAQLDWTADQMAKQTEVQYLLDEENEEQDNCR